MIAETCTYDAIWETLSVPRTQSGPPRPEVIAVGSFASPESPCTFFFADVLVHPTLSVINMLSLVFDLQTRVASLGAVVKCANLLESTKHVFFRIVLLSKPCILCAAPSAIFE